MEHTPQLQSVTWSDVREQVKQVAPDIFEAIERMNPDKSYRLYKARYPFGAMIIGEHGTFNIPYNNKLITMPNSAVPKKLLNDFTSRGFAIPVSLVLSGQVQLYTEENNNIVTECIYDPGIVMALWAALDPPLTYQAKRIWCMTSGARTSMMLSSLSDQNSFDQLKRHFNLQTGKPETQQDHWKLFVEIANHKNFSESWYTELLLFPDKWLQPEESDAWKLFHWTLLKRVWAASAQARNIRVINRLWANFTSTLINKSVTDFILNTVRYIVEASLNQAITYTPCDGGNRSGPFDTIVDIIMNVYGLKKSAPILMVPAYFDLDNPTVNYISIQTPASHWLSKGYKATNNLINDEREIKQVLMQFLKFTENNQFLLETTPFLRLLEIDYTFYNADKDKHNQLLLSSHALDGHPIMEKWRKHPTNNELAYRNTFMRSCVKLESKEKK